MSLLDARHPELDLFLQRWRNRLNGRFLTGEALTAWAVAALPALAAEFAGSNPWLRVAVWALLAGLGTAAFTLWRARRRLSLVQAGLWLDEAGRTRGLFTAAAECLEKQESPAARRVLAEAEKQVGAGRNLRLPWKRLAVRALAAATSSVLCLWVLSLAAPRGLGPLSEAPPPAAQAQVRPGADLPPNGSRELSSQEAARRLFPEDTRLAALAEQALASGDPGALEALLEQNADAVAAAEARGLPRSRPEGGSQAPGEQPGQKGRAPEGTPPQGTPGKPGSSGSGSGSGSDSDKKGSGGAKSQEGGSSPKGDGTSRGSQKGAGGAGDSGPGQARGGGELPFGSGGAPGKEHSDLAFGPLERRGNSSKQIPLKDPSSAGVFEYILPGAESKLPLAQVLADSRRSAEALFSRTLPPQEFENTIRDYFLSLSQEVSP